MSVYVPMMDVGPVRVRVLESVVSVRVTVTRRPASGSALQDRIRHRSSYRTWSRVGGLNLLHSKEIPSERGATASDDEGLDPRGREARQ